MVKITTLNTRKPPEGWSLIEPVLTELEEKMREAVRAPHEGKRKNESLWPIYRIHHQRSRYIYDVYYKKEMISKDLYEFCCQQGYADRNLIAKWRKPGFEKLCCLMCIESSNTNFGTACVCRVPKKDLTGSRDVECTKCGCRGCASGD